MTAQSDRQDPQALIVFAHSPGPEWEETKWVPPRVFLRGVAERFRAELLCCGAVNELDDQALSSNLGIKLTAKSLQETAREDKIIPLVVLIADDDGLRSTPRPDRLALRKVITNCCTCILDVYAGNAVVSWLDGLLHGATIPRQAHWERYGCYDLSMQNYCRLEGRNNFTPYGHAIHRNILYTESLAELTAFERRDLEGKTVPRLQDHVEKLCKIALKRVSSDKPAHAERLIVSPAVVLFEGQKLEMSRGQWVLDRVASFEHLDFIIVGDHQVSGARDVIAPNCYYTIGEDESEDEDDDDEGRVDLRRVDLSNPKIERLASLSAPFHHDAVFFLDGATLNTPIDNAIVMAKIVALVDAASIVVCDGTAVWLLAATGLLDGHCAAVEASKLDEAKSRFPRVKWSSESPLARHGKFVTATELVGRCRSFPHTVLAIDAAVGAVEAKQDYELLRNQEPTRQWSASRAVKRVASQVKKRVAKIQHRRRSVPPPGAPVKDLLAYLESRLHSRGELVMPGATEQDIRDAEERLGEALPQDFRDFLLLSNGLERYDDEDDEETRYVELKRCGDLEWDDVFTAADNDDGALPLEVEPEFQDGSREPCSMAAPFLARPKEFKGVGIIDISDDSDHKNVWLVSPRLVRFAREQAGPDLEWKWGSEVGWRVITWRHWCPDHLRLHRSFTHYLRYVAIGKQRR